MYNMVTNKNIPQGVTKWQAASYTLYALMPPCHTRCA